MKIKELTVTLAAVDDNGISAAQQLVGAGNLLLNGALVVAGAATLDYARQLGMFSSGNISTVVFTITGTDANGNAITDTITGINNSTVETTKYFKTVTQIAADAAVGTDVIAGTVDEIATQAIPLNAYEAIAATVSVVVTGTINFTVQETFDNVLRLGSSSITWQNVTALATKTATTVSPISVHATATRTIVNSHSSGAALAITIIPTNTF